MGTPKMPKPVRRIVGVLSNQVEGHTSATSLLAELFGPVTRVTERYPWDFSPKYTAELGPHIQRSFIVFAHLQSAENLARWKLATNAIEGQATDNLGNRTVNLDPGYVDGCNVVLASTKNYANRVYLRDGVYADLTLYFDGRSFRPFKHTLPDYRTRSAIRFFNSVRREYLTQLVAATETSTGATTVETRDEAVDRQHGFAFGRPMSRQTN